MAEPLPAGWLTDTNVLSRPAKKNKDDPPPPVELWIRANARLIRVSAVTIAEARRGLVLDQKRIDGLGDRRVIRRDQAVLDFKVGWYKELRLRYADRIVPIDAEVAERWADVSVRFPSIRDGDKAILATALVHGYGVATRNIRDFKASGVPLVDPFDPHSWWEDEAQPHVPKPKG